MRRENVFSYLKVNEGVSASRSDVGDVLQQFGQFVLDAAQSFIIILLLSVQFAFEAGHFSFIFAQSGGKGLDSLIRGGFSLSHRSTRRSGIDLDISALKQQQTQG